jgi:hypothetical protein
LKAGAEISVPSAPPSKAPGWYLLLALLLIGFVYWGGFGNGFVWLDQSEIIEHQLIVDDWDGALSLFANDRNNPGYQRPAYSLMHSLDWALWGPNPRGFLRSSLLLHLANVALAFALLRRLSMRALTAALIAGLWGLHPVNSAVVGLIHSKADLLFLFGVLASSVCYLRASSRSGTSDAERAGGWMQSLNWLGAGAAFALALFSKETALLLPLIVTSIVLLPKLWSDQELSPGSLKRSNLIRFAGLLWFLTFIVLAMRWDSMSGKNYASELPLIERLLTFGSVYIGYLKTLFVPLQLSICDTVTRFSANATGVQFRFITSLVIVIGLQVWSAIKHPWTRRWIVLFNFALVPVSQVIPILHFRADRFLYLPSLALVGLTVEGVQRAVEQRLNTGESAKSARRGIIAVLIFVVLFFVGRILVRLTDFRNDETLFKAELVHTPDYLEGLSVLGRTYDRLGHHERAGELFRLAQQEYPGRISYMDRGGVAIAYAYNLLARGEVQAAKEFLLGCRDQRFSSVRSRELSYNLAVAQFRLGEYKSALEGFQRYSVEDPTDPSCHYFMGRAAMLLDQRDSAKEWLGRYLELAPEAPDRNEVLAWLEELSD